MNISTFYGLNVGMTALDSAQQVEDVISNNIANANTAGYAQETANLSEIGPFPTLPAQDAPVVAGQMGEGAQVSGVQRDTNAFLDRQDRENQGTSQMYQTHSQNLTMIEGILNEPSSQSMQNAVDQFFSSWQTLSTDPSNTAARQAVIAQAQTL
ncbi:MAG: flagellar basal body protein, partial [Firmicutes bacterium]|nr:flagellar basal body protein [Bacillota bacterium]